MLKAGTSIRCVCLKSIARYATSGTVTSLQRGERTFLMIKPDALQRCLAGEILKRIEQRGYQMMGLKLCNATSEQLRAHYSHSLQADYFPLLMKIMTSGPIILSVWQGLQAVNVVRSMVGETEPKSSLPGTIRGDFGLHLRRNLVHASDSVETAAREIAIWFQSHELVEWTQFNERWSVEVT